jgi:hypothetical protein
LPTRFSAATKNKKSCGCESISEIFTGLIFYHWLSLRPRERNLSANRRLFQDSGRLQAGSKKVPAIESGTCEKKEIVPDYQEFINQEETV